MDIYQLKTFVVVAREGSVTRASEVLHLSQPAVSAHIKTMEENLGLSLFERTPRGMSLTRHGERLLPKAERALAAHQELMDEAARNRGVLTGKLCLGAGTNSDNAAIGKLLTILSERYPGVEVALKHGTSRQILADIRSGSLDAGFYNDPSEPESDLVAIEASQFKIYVGWRPALRPAQRTSTGSHSQSCLGSTRRRVLAVVRPPMVSSSRTNSNQNVSSASIVKSLLGR